MYKREKNKVSKSWQSLLVSFILLVFLLPLGFKSVHFHSFEKENITYTNADKSKKQEAPKKCDSCLICQFHLASFTHPNLSYIPLFLPAFDLVYAHIFTTQIANKTWTITSLRAPPVV